MDWTRNFSPSLPSSEETFKLQNSLTRTVSMTLQQWRNMGGRGAVVPGRRAKGGAQIGGQKSIFKTFL